MQEVGSCPTAAAALKAEESGTALGIGVTRCCSRSSSVATRIAATSVCSVPAADDASLYFTPNRAREAGKHSRMHANVEHGRTR